MSNLPRSALEVYREKGLEGLRLRAKKKFVNEVTKPLVNWQFKKKYGTGIDVMAEDWDNLIILDACRYDVFQARNTLDGTLRRVVSQGSNSKEFLDKSFRGKQLHNTVYVTANPYVTRIEDDVFHAVLTVLDEWDEDIQTVMPGSVVDRAVEAHEEYPNKRLIVHFMQPHQPYIGSAGQAVREKMRDRVDVIGWKGEPQAGVKQIRAPKVDEIDVSKEDILEAYRENLDIALEHTEELLDTVGGKTVLTSDHGELFGEQLLPLSRELYGHPSDLWTPKIRFVPWHIINAGDRRRIVSETGDVYEDVDKDTLEAKLRALGYQS